MMEQINKTDKIFLTGEQVNEINECLNFLNGYIGGILLIGKGCFLAHGNIADGYMGMDEIGMALQGLSDEAGNKWSSIQDIITDEVYEQIEKQRKETIHE